MAKRLFITPLAKQDLEHIFHYGAREFGVESAVNFLAKFENAFSLLLDFDIGTACPDVKSGCFVTWSGVMWCYFSVLPMKCGLCGFCTVRGM